ncbi:MAG TPA: hypothetical protein VMF61_03640 [Candidatus Acidoferrales bacterium]|nr:hypothetical protein [Candidatus Acidoferrales bacterium]
MVRQVFTILLMVFATALPQVASADAMPNLPPQPKVRPAGLPAGYVLVSPCIATMGEHWANPKDPQAPIYGTWQGKVIFTEIMVPLTQLQQGFSYADLRPLPGNTIDHVDFEFEPHGHEGMPVPHYDLHAYYISAAAQAAVCPDGIPDPALKPQNSPP